MVPARQALWWKWPSSRCIYYPTGLCRGTGKDEIRKGGEARQSKALILAKDSGLWPPGDGDSLKIFEQKNDIIKRAL